MCSRRKSACLKKDKKEEVEDGRVPWQVFSARCGCQGFPLVVLAWLRSLARALAWWLCTCISPSSPLPNGLYCKSGFRTMVLQSHYRNMMKQWKAKISPLPKRVCHEFTVSDTSVRVQVCHKFYFIPDSVLMGDSRILSCHDMKLALNVCGPKTNVGFMFVLYFAIQIFC